MSARFAETEPFLEQRAAIHPPSRGPSNTLLICGVMLGMAAIAGAMSTNAFDLDKEVLIRLGANWPQATLDRWGFWHLLGAKFLTTSWIGVGFFMPFFWLASRAFERVYGRAWHLFTFVAVSALSSTATLLWRFDEAGVSVGAGGPALAMATGVGLAAFGHAPGAPAPGSMLSWKLLPGVPYIVLLIVSLMTGSADVPSLLTGLVSGLVIGFVLPTAPDQHDRSQKVPMAAAALLVVAVVAVGLQFVRPPSYYRSEQQAYVKLARDVEADVNALNQATRALTDQQLEGRISRETLGAKLEAEVLPRWRAAAGRWANVSVNPSVPDSNKMPHLKIYIADRTRFLAASARAWRTDDVDALIEAASYLESSEVARGVMAGPSIAK